MAAGWFLATYQVSHQNDLRRRFGRIRSHQLWCNSKPRLSSRNPNPHRSRGARNPRFEILHSLFLAFFVTAPTRKSAPSLINSILYAPWTPAHLAKAKRGRSMPMDLSISFNSRGPTSVQRTIETWVKKSSRYHRCGARGGFLTLTGQVRGLCRSGTVDTNIHNDLRNPCFCR
jgi:hypothetical protein